MHNHEEATDEQLQEILADFSALGHATYLDDPVLGFDYASAELDEMGLPRFSPEVPRVPVVPVERHQEMWTHPDNPGPRQEIWTDRALSQGMGRIGTGVQRLPSLDGWLMAEWPGDGGGLQLQQPDGRLFVYALCAFGSCRAPRPLAPFATLTVVSVLCSCPQPWGPELPTRW